MVCKHCSCPCLKVGLRNGVQKFRCKSCRRYQQEIYSYTGYHPGLTKRIISLVKEGVGVRGIARILSISTGTVLRRIRQASKSVFKPISNPKNQTYEIDELWTYIGKKSNEVWITYAFNRFSRTVVDFKIGGRTKENLQSVVSGILVQTQKKCLPMD